MSSQDVAQRAVLIAAEKVRIQYRNMPTAFIGSAIVCSLMGFALLSGAGLEKTIAWMAVVYLWVITRFIQWRDSTESIRRRTKCGRGGAWASVDRRCPG
jgi:hypothetical protein